jgi:macrolide transport system ATP-binding/permease protein
MFRDLQHGLRVLTKNPGFTIIAVVSIAIGVGANAAMFSLADGLVLRPLRVPRSSEIVAVSATAPRVGADFVSGGGLSRPDYLDLRDRAGSFSGLLAYSTMVSGFANSQDEPPQSMLGLAVSGNFFDVLGLQPALGRFFLPDEDRVAGRDAVMVIAHDVWTDRFGADPMILGRHVTLGGLDFEIVGVAPERFEGMHLAVHPVYYVPYAMTAAPRLGRPDVLYRRDVRGLTVKGRLKAGVSLAQAREETRLIAAGLEAAHPGTNRGYGMLVRSDFEARIEERGPSAPGAFMLLTLAFVVLLVACANVAGLLMSRGPAREREIALRLAIGGGRGRVIRQLVTESVLLAVAGGLFGLALGYIAVGFFSRLPLVSDIGVRLIFELDARAIAVGVVLAAASALLSSLVPAWRVTRRVDLASALKSGTTGGRRGTRLWGQNGLVAGQVALSMILLAVTVFLGRAFERELRQPGFRTTQMLLSNYEPFLARYDETQTKAFYRELKERVLGLPRVTSVGMTSVMPLNQDNREATTIVPEGSALPPGTNSVNVLSSRIDDGYLSTMNIPVMQGRGIESIDTEDAPRVAVINQAMAQRYWPEQNAVGKRLRLVSRDGQPWAAIVGVVANNKSNFIGEGPTPWMYLAQRQDPGVRTTLIVATAGDSAALASPLRGLVRDLAPSMPVSGVRTIEEFYRGNAIGIITALVAITASMGLLGLTLAMIGLYGLVSYVVARQTREIGIRMAVGAQRGTVLRMVLQRGFWRAAWGAAFGIAGCVAAGRLLRAVFPTVGSIDLGTYAMVIAILAAVTLLASFVPAWRAAHIDPLRALRQD